MEWLELHIDTNHAGLEPLEIFLSANGVDGVVIDDEQDFQSFWKTIINTGTMWTRI